jgi:hypothetical protein
VDATVATVRGTPADTPSGWWALVAYIPTGKREEHREIRLPTFALPAWTVRGTRVPLVYAGSRGYGIWTPEPGWLTRERTGKEEAT